MKRATVTIKGWDGKNHSGKGVIGEESSNGVVIVRMATNDLGGFGTYRKGESLRFFKDEITETKTCTQPKTTKAKKS